MDEMAVSINDQLRARYIKPEWAIFFEVANGPGSGLRRYADAIAMSLYPSRGLNIHGFEVKASRNDWLNELKKPEKADEIAKYCDFWWLVVTSKDIVKDGELPTTWGLLVSNGKGLRQVKAPKPLEPAALSRPFVAAMLRRAHENVEDSIRNAKEVKDAYERGVTEGKQDVSYEQDRNVQELQGLRETIQAFEKASGVKIDRYEGGERIGDAVKAVLWMSHHDGPTELTKAAEQLERSAKQIREKAEAIEAVRVKSDRLDVRESNEERKQ